LPLTTKDSIIPLRNMALKYGHLGELVKQESKETVGLSIRNSIGGTSSYERGMNSTCSLLLHNIRQELPWS
jgi:hypothetical protein